MAAHPVVLGVQDTTEPDFNGQQIAGLGPLSYEAQRGMDLRPTLGVNPAREPLGGARCLDVGLCAEGARRFAPRCGGERRKGGWRATRGWQSWRPSCLIPAWSKSASASPACSNCWYGRARGSIGPTSCCARSTTGRCRLARQSGVSCWASGVSHVLSPGISQAISLRMSAAVPH